MLLAAIGALGGLVLYVFSDQIILLLYGQEFHPSIDCLQILSAFTLFYYLNGVLAYAMIAMNKDKYVAVILAASTVCNIAMCYYLIPIYSYNGAAIAMVLSETLIFIFYSLIYKKAVIPV
jgi:O-antigen/teichoic acid export membrane protein